MKTGMQNWRKTRSRQNGRLCVGVDANRNWGHQWGGNGSVSDPCDYQYQGLAPFSEPETQAVKNFILSLGNVIMYLSLHSYGQFVIYPSREEKDDEEQLLAQMAAETLGDYTTMTVDTAGCSMKWAWAEAGARFAFTIELPPRRDEFTNNPHEGFELPATKIEVVGEKMVVALMAMGEVIVGYGYV